MEHIKNVSDAFNFGDNEVRTWFLVRHKYLPFILSGTYVLMASKVGPALMRDRKPFDLRRTMVVFDFLLVLVYLIALTLYTWYLPKMSWVEICKGSYVVKGHPAYMIASILWVIYILKYIEYMDTMFFVLRKKNNLVSFLHVFHHSFTPLVGWLVGRLSNSAFQTFPIILNSMVHVVMYSYYGLAAMGPEYRKYIWWKKYLTQLQIIQFFVILIFVGVITPLSGCTDVQEFFIFKLISTLLFLYLFLQFYQKVFMSEPSQAKRPEVEEISNGRKQK